MVLDWLAHFGHNSLLEEEMSCFPWSGQLFKKSAECQAIRTASAFFSLKAMRRFNSTGDILFFFSQVGRRSELRVNLTSERLEVHALPNIETTLLLFIALKNQSHCTERSATEASIRFSLV